MENANVQLQFYEPKYSKTSKITASESDVFSKLNLIFGHDSSNSFDNLQKIMHNYFSLMIIQTAQLSKFLQKKLKL